MKIVYLSLGSNIGNKIEYLKKACRMLGENKNILVDKTSKVYKTSAVSDIDQNKYMNMALKIVTTMSVEDLLNEIHIIEHKLNRVRELRWGPRTLDIDIIFYDNKIIKTNNLIVPHKETFNRLFVLLPLKEIIDEKSIYIEKINDGIKLLKKTKQEIMVVNNLEDINIIEESISNIIEELGDDITRNGLIDTPKRVSKAYKEIFSSQGQKYFNDYKIFKMESNINNEIVSMNNIQFYSMCEHHILPFFGKVNISYKPKNNNIIGLSKIPKLIDFMSHKLQIQERLTKEIGDELSRILNPEGVFIEVEARHLCVEMRGIKKSNSITKTSYKTGIFKQ